MLTLSVADPERFTPKSKSVIYTGTINKIYNWKNDEQVHKIWKMIDFEKICALTIENLRNLGAHWIIEILLVLHGIYVISKD